MKTPRTYYLLLALGCSALLGFGYYLQFGTGLEPCPLCILQRVAYFAVVFIALLGCLHGPQHLGLRIYSGLITIAAGIGAGIAGWQVRLQHLPPDQIPECGPGLNYMLEYFDLNDVMRMIFTGSGECAEVQWQFLTLSIAEWSLLCFSAITISALIHTVRRRLFWVF